MIQRNQDVAYRTTMDEVEGRSPAVYDLDDERRDVLIVHARQDAAHALCNTISAAKDMAGVRMLLWANLAGIILVFCAIKRWI